MSKVGRMDLNIIQGADINDLTIVPTYDDGGAIDLTGFDARMTIKSEDLSQTFDTLTTDNSRIEIISFEKDGETFYKIKVKFPNSDTSSYSFKKGVYDLEIYKAGTPDTDVDRLLEGFVIVNEEVTTS